jgi:NAD(P)-dependent dehydrogenase (short-subunit alcohol dehydrogenase family)
MSDSNPGNSNVLALMGVGPGLGTSIPLRFAREGWSVGLVARNQSNLDATRAALEKDGAANGTNIVTAAADGTDAGQTGSAFDRIREGLGDPDVLVYNAGAFMLGGILDLSEEDFVRSWEANCLGAFLAVRQVLPAMVKAGRGTILLTGATGSLRGGANFSCLAVGKFGLRALGQSLAREFGPQGIHVAHVVVDGQIANPRTLERFAGAERPEDSFLSADAIAETYWQLHAQHPTAWSQEVDLRPYLEKF